MEAVHNFIHNVVCFPFKENPKKYITYAWFLSIILVAAAMISACILADKHRDNGTSALGFAAVWTAIICMAISVGGTVVMRKFQTSFAIGVFLGVVSVAANQCLMLVRSRGVPHTFPFRADLRFTYASF
jgi:uncharacterized BrkB/YihY/UPF0761 family membrane protein